MVGQVTFSRMDSENRISELKRWVKEFCDERGWNEPHTPKDLAIGVTTEAAELLEIFRFVSRENETDVIETEREHIGDELADTFYFLLRFAERYGFDLSECLAAKLKKNATRYPPKKHF